ncbi:MAG: hypothetical protein ABIG42_10490 [bacterium]
MADGCCTPENIKVQACSTSCCGHSFRRFTTNEEKLECLEKYKAELEKELVGLKEHIKELSSD